MVRIRLRRMGAKKKPFYRIVVADQRSPRDGRFIETIGTYNPLTEPETVDLKLARAAHWLSVGAQPTDAVARLLQQRKLLDENGKPIPLSEDALQEAADAVPEAAAAEASPSEAEGVETAADEAEADAAVEPTADAAPDAGVPEADADAAVEPTADAAPDAGVPEADADAEGETVAETAG